MRRVIGDVRLAEVLHLRGLPVPAGEGGVRAVAAVGGVVVEDDVFAVVNLVVIVDRGEDVGVDLAVEVEPTGGAAHVGVVALGDGRHDVAHVLAEPGAEVEVAAVDDGAEGVAERGAGVDVLVPCGVGQQHGGVVGLGGADCRSHAEEGAERDIEARLRVGAEADALDALGGLAQAFDDVRAVAHVREQQARGVGGGVGGGDHRGDVVDLGGHAYGEVGAAVHGAGRGRGEVAVGVGVDAFHLKAQLLGLEAEPVDKGFAVAVAAVGEERHRLAAVVDDLAQEHFALGDVRFGHGPQVARARIAADELLGGGQGQEGDAVAAEARGQAARVGGIEAADDGVDVVARGDFLGQSVDVFGRFVVVFEGEAYAVGLSAECVLGIAGEEAEDALPVLAHAVGLRQDDDYLLLVPDGLDRVRGVRVVRAGSEQEHHQQANQIVTGFHDTPFLFELLPESGPV